MYLTPQASGPHTFPSINQRVRREWDEKENKKEGEITVGAPRACLVADQMGAR